MDLEQLKERLGHLRGLAPRGRSLAAFLFALLIVSTAAGSGWLGPGAQRVHERTSPVGEADAIVCGGLCVAGVGAAVGFGAGYIVTSYLSGDSTSDTYTSAEKSETQIEVYLHGKTIQSGARTVDVIMQNQVADGSRTVAWTKGKAAAIRSLNDGANESEAKAAAKDAVSDYYNSMQVNLVNQHNDETRKVKYLMGVYDGHADLSGGAAVKAVDPDDRRQTINWSVDHTAQVTTVNGTEVNVSAYKTSEWHTGSSLYTVNTYLSPFGTVPESEDTFSDAEIEFQATNSSLEGIDGDYIAQDFNQRNTTWTDIENADSQMRSNLDLWVENTYSGYTAGDINSTELVDPATLAQEFSTDFNDTGYYAYAAGDLALQGTNGTFNESFTIELADGTTWNGTLFTDWEPSSTSGEFRTGTTYNISNATSPVYFATNDGLRMVQQDFDIIELTNVQTGETLNNTTLQNYNRQTADTTLTQEQLDQLVELRQELDEQQANAGGGGLLGSLGLDGMSTGVILALGAVLALFLLKPE